MSETILFFGSGPVAAQSLKLLAKDFKIEAVITKPQPPNHKYPLPVVEAAKKLGLTIFNPDSSQSLSALFKTVKLTSPIGLVIDYGIIIKKDVISSFTFGIINSHFSLLPKWRGADPISYAILNGDKYSGVSLMQINSKLDEGPILAQSKLKLKDDITGPELTNELILLSHDLILNTLPEYLKGKVKPKPQKGVPTYSRKLTKFDSWLDWHKPAITLEREIRAFLDWPRSRAKIGPYEVIINKAHIEALNGPPGKILIDKSKLTVCCAQNSLVIDELTPPGKKNMTTRAFLAGYNINLQ